MAYRLGPASLKEALTGMNVDWLQAMMRALPVPPPKPTRKVDIVKAIVRCLDGAKLRELWSRMDDLQQLAVAEALYGPAGRFNARQFRAEHGRLPEGCKVASSYDFSVLRFFLFPLERHLLELVVVPSDLADRLREFVPRPPELVLDTVEECPEFIERRLQRWVVRGGEEKFESVALVRRYMEEAAVEDLFATLRLIDDGKLAVGPKTRRPSSRTVELLGGVLHGGDYFLESKRKGRRLPQPIGAIRAYAWPWLVQAGGLAEPARGKLALTPAGRAAFSARSALTLRRIWTRWLANTLLDEFNRIDEVKGQFRGRGRQAMTSPRGRRKAIVDVLAECPTGRWVEVDEFHRFMKAKGRDFEVTRNLWRLYIVDPEYGNFGYETAGAGDELETRYLLCFLFEYAATLGLVDVAFTAPENARLDWVSRWGADDLDFLSRYDGLEFFRVNPLGAYCLGGARRYEPSNLPAPSALTVLPDLRVRASAPVLPAERFLLETYAVVEAEGVWRLNLDRALTALEHGHEPAEFRKFLAARDDQPLPEKVEGFLRLIERGMHALKPAVNALLIECGDAEIADRIAANPQAAKYCLRTGPRGLSVPVKSEKKFRRAVHALGYALPPT